MHDFQKKSQFLKSVKNSNKINIDMQNNEKEGLRNYVLNSLLVYSNILCKVFSKKRFYPFFHTYPLENFF